MGNMLEWYDFTVYALFATYVGKSFFPPGGSSGANVVKAFLAFGLGFVVRPLGAVLIGNYGDRAGRKAALTLTIALMAAGTGIIALAPTYSVIGLGAPLLLLLGRLLQGFSAGGEVGSATAFLAENASVANRGVVTSWLEASMGMSNILGALVAFTVTTLLTTEAVEAWGWRIPFLFGLLILPAGLYLRRRVHETSSFQIEMQRRGPAGGDRRSALTSVVDVFTSHRRALLTGFGTSVLWAVAVYVLIIYLPTYARLTFGFSPQQAFGASLIANVMFVVSCVTFGALSDRIGRRRQLLLSALSLLVCVLPLLKWLQADPTTGTLIAVQTAFCILVASFVGVAPAGIAEIFPTRTRATGTALVYNSAFTIFGGFSPWMLARLAQVSGGSPLAPAWYVMAAAVLAVCAIPFLGGRESPDSGLTLASPAAYEE
jgi:MHS family proline/betaine transporter-like MFS transporter